MSAHPGSPPLPPLVPAASGLGAASLLLPSRWAPADAAGDPWARADAIAAGITVPTFPDRDFDITRHGAAPDGADATAAIARAVAACSAAGGGRVLVPAGTFHTGPIHLRSGVHLHVAKGPCSASAPTRGTTCRWCRPATRATTATTTRH